MLETYWRRVASQNPLEPYTWEARYYGGGRLRQFDVDGYHNSHEIELPRLQSLAVIGPGFEYEMPRPYERRRPLKQVRMFARNTITVGGSRPEHSVEFYHFGLVYDNPDGSEAEFALRFYSTGEMILYTPEKLAGEIISTSP